MPNTKIINMGILDGIDNGVLKSKMVSQKN